MGAVRVEIAETVEGVAPEQALEWWTDYREGSHDHSFVRGSQRRVHESEKATMIEDRVAWLGVPVFTERVRAQQRGNKVELLGENTWATFRARYVFESVFDPEGTEVQLTADVDLRGPLSIANKPARPAVKRILQWDTRKHLDEMREDLLGRERV